MPFFITFDEVFHHEHDIPYPSQGDTSYHVPALLNSSNRLSRFTSAPGLGNQTYHFPSLSYAILLSAKPTSMQVVISVA